MLSKQQFNVLAYIHENDGNKLTQLKIAKQVGISVGSVNKIITGFKNKGYLADVDRKFIITNNGYDILEQFRVKRAVILAAGFSQRMMPLSLYSPTAMLFVRGKRLIEILLDALLDKKIIEIYIVRGFLGENFDCILENYPMVRFIENADFKEAQSASSCYVARNFLENAYILHSDIYVSGTNVIREYEYEPNYLGKYKESTDDWNFEIDNGIITGIKQGGMNCYLMYGVTYLNREAGIVLKNILENEYKTAPGFKEKMLDIILLNSYNGRIRFSLRECSEDDIFEFDSLRELQIFDPLYKY